MSLGWVTALLETVCGTGGIIIAGLVCLSVYKKTTFEILKSTNEALEQSNKQYKEDMGKLLKKISALEETSKAQDSRIYTMEIEKERTFRLLKTARREITMLEEMIEQAFMSLSKAGHQDDAQKIVQLRAALVTYRRESDEDLEAWQRLQDATTSWLKRSEGGTLTDDMNLRIQSRETITVKVPRSLQKGDNIAAS